ncbi:MAG: hypothetical protein JWM19_3624 [Actinomycetia bacterium]|nr:hypothetical protein [Actinomycetes bacterium]
MRQVPVPAGTRASRPRVGVSSCLLGEPVRFNGGHSRCRFLADELGPYVDGVPYCPEMEIGLDTPRETLRLPADGRLVSRSGGDRRRADLLSRIESYRRGTDPLSVPIAILAH